VHDLLRGAVTRGRLPHAYLFHGAAGVGKTSTAFALAQFLNCSDPGPEEACGGCGSCFRFMHLNHPDLHWFFPMPGRIKGGKRVEEINRARALHAGPDIHVLEYPEAASIPIGKDRDTRAGSVAELRHEAGMAPVEAKVKVFVVSEADRLTPAAANSLLKVLEEPEPGTLLVLCTSNPGAMLDTIVSRCHSLRFRDLTEETVRRQITARTGVDGTPAALAAGLARGSLTRARSLVQSEVERTDEVDKRARRAAREAEAVAKAKAGGKKPKKGSKAKDDDELPMTLVELRDTAVEFLGVDPESREMASRIATITKTRDRARVRRMIEMSQLWLGDLLRVAVGAEVPLTNADRAEDLRKLGAGIDPLAIGRQSRALERARVAMEGNGYLPLVLHELALSLREDTLVATTRR